MSCRLTKDYVMRQIYDNNSHYYLVPKTECWISKLKVIREREVFLWSEIGSFVVHNNVSRDCGTIFQFYKNFERRSEKSSALRNRRWKIMYFISRLMVPRTIECTYRVFIRFRGQKTPMIVFQNCS